MTTPDPWDEMPDHDRFPELPETPASHEPPLMTRGEMAFYGCFFVAIVGGIILLAVKIVSAWLELP